MSNRAPQDGADARAPRGHRESAIYYRPMSRPSSSLRSATRGPVPPEGPLHVHGLDLPPGVHIRPDVLADGNDAPCAWVTRDPVDHDALQLWIRHLAAHFAETGLWPITASGSGGDLGDPWHEGLVMGPVDDDFDAEAFLLAPRDPQDLEDSRYAAYLESIAPIATVRALGGPVASPPPRADELLVRRTDEPMALALIPATSPADCLAALGWLGPANYEVEGAAIGRIAASWQERYHLVPVGIGLDVLSLQVPPQGLDRPELMNLLAEIYQDCPDIYDQGGYRSLEAFVEVMETAAVIDLWWD